MTQRELEIKAHNYLIKNSYNILSKLSSYDIEKVAIKEVLMQIYIEAFNEGLNSEEAISDAVNQRMDEDQLVSYEILQVHNI